MDVAAASGMSGASGASGPVFGGGPMTGSGIGSQGSAYPPPPPPPPPEEQRDGLPPQQEGDRGSGQQATRQTEEGVSRGDSGSDIASIPSPPHTTGDGATGAGGASALYPPPPPPGQQQPQQYAGQDPTQIGQAFPPPPPPGFDSGAGMPGGRSGAEEGPVRVTGTTDGLDPKEVEAFFAAQAEYGNSGSPPVDGECSLCGVTCACEGTWLVSGMIWKLAVFRGLDLTIVFGNIFCCLADGKRQDYSRVGTIASYALFTLLCITDVYNPKSHE